MLIVQDLWAIWTLKTVCNMDSGVCCDLCHLPAVTAEGATGAKAAVEIGPHVLHLDCCKYANNSAISSIPSRMGKDINSRAAPPP